MDTAFNWIKAVKFEHVLIGIKTIVAILLILCLFNMTRGYYQFVRISVFVFCIWLTYDQYFKGIYVAAIPAFLCAVLFNPIIKFYIPKKDWLFIYAALAVCLIAWSVYDLYLLDKKGDDKPVERQATVDNPNP